MEASFHGGSVALTGGVPGGGAMSEGADSATLQLALSRGDRAAAERLVESSYRQVYAALFRMCGGDAGETYAAADAAERLRRAVLKLPEDLRFTVSAHFWSELPVSEVARLEE